ncbi:MAG: hypothetical protein Q8O30_05455 [Candidatus Omnitrophota bacterium]|nr:hypothetical protein [Candidatus Omnitrophota bacterium]
MGVLFCGIITFVLAFVIHLVIWKVCLAKINHTVVLLGIFLGTLIVVIIVSRTLQNSLSYKIFRLETGFDYLDFLILYGSLILAYIATYSAIEVDSPSLVIILNIAKAGPNGLDRIMLHNIMNDENLVMPRIKDLVNDKMVYFDNDRYKLSPKGILMAKVFALFRKILNAPMGG